MPNHLLTLIVAPYSVPTTVLLVLAHGDTCCTTACATLRHNYRLAHVTTRKPGLVARGVMYVYVQVRKIQPAIRITYKLTNLAKKKEKQLGFSQTQLSFDLATPAHDSNATQFKART